jgi:3',5'-cyclic AMP phosphodiesterase CpdA
MSEPLFSFGVVTDPQFAHLPVTLNRYYEQSLDKLAAAADELNQHDLAFVASLGDVIDRNWESFDEILAVYAGFKAPVRHVLGNHDFLVGDDRVDQVSARLGMPARHYDFPAPAGFRFVVVDGTEVSTFGTREGTREREFAEATLAGMLARGEPNAQRWNGGISDVQFAWLADVLHGAEAAGERVIVLGHFPIHPFTNHSLWNAGRLLETLAGSPAVAAYLNGHDHAGNYGEVNGKHFVNFRGMVDTADTTAYARVEVHSDRLEVIGFGTEPSRTLPYRSNPIDE